MSWKYREIAIVRMESKATKEEKPTRDMKAAEKSVAALRLEIDKLKVVKTEAQKRWVRRRNLDPNKKRWVFGKGGQSLRLPEREEV